MLALDREHRSLPAHLARLVRYHELVFNLAARDLKVRYKQSVLGVAWAILQPLALMVVFSVIFALFVKVKTSGMPYPVFSYVALVPWTFFTNALSFGILSLVGNYNLVVKIYFPREILPLASVVACFVDFLVASTIFAAMLAFYHIGLTAQALWLPLIVVLQIAFVSGVLLIFAAANVFYRDIRLLLPFLLQVWMYVTPVIYPLAIVPARLRPLFTINPMTGIIESYRRVTLLGQPPDPRLLAFTAAMSLGVLALGYGYFKAVEMKFADII